MDLSSAPVYRAMLAIIVIISSNLIITSDAQYVIPYEYNPCVISPILRGEWFSRERGENVLTQIDASSISTYGRCLDVASHQKDNFNFALQSQNCFYCVRILVRTLNVLEKIESGCVNLSPNDRPTLQSICRTLDPNQQLNTMFSTNPSGKNCRSSLEGVWKFAYQNRYKFTGECTHPEANITACQRPGTQFFNVNQQFIINYRKCDGFKDTENAEVQFKCLGDWYVRKNHFFAVVNSRESRIEEKYRCFLANRDDDVYLSVSITAECNTLRSPQEGPERLRLFPVKNEVVPAKCTLPHNYTGIWVNTANFDAEVTVNSTQMVEKWNPDTGRVKQEIYVCQERRDSRFVMARLGINGCQKDYVCFDFVPRHHNIIRYRKGQAMITDHFATVCAWTMFDDEVEWKYDIMIKKNPVSIKCPVGKPVDIYSEAENKMQCIGFWKENLKSYLIIYDQFDAYSRYQCWVYQLADLNKILMSMSVGAFCHIRQDVTSGLSREGAQVHLAMVEYELEHDDCGMYFDDGSDPYRTVVDSATVLRSPNS